jgi:hypothetical protein
MTRNSTPLAVTNDPGEVWASIDGAPAYWISSEGRVRHRGRLLRLQQGDAVGHLTIHVGARGRQYVHRLVAEHFIPNDAGLPLVRHLEGDVDDNRVTELAWGDSAMNHADAQRHGTAPTALHGTKSRYSAGCRCLPCTKAASAERRVYRERTGR